MNPPALESKPVIHQWMHEYVSAFNLLHKTRSYGMTANPISLSEILAYLKLYGSSDTEAFVQYVTEMDASYLAVINEEKTKDGSGSRT